PFMSEQNWISIPQIAQEIRLPERTARRWAGLLHDLLPQSGRGAARRFHPQAKETLLQAKGLFHQGMRQERVAAILRAETAQANTAATKEPNDLPDTTPKARPSAVAQHDDASGPP